MRCNKLAGNRLGRASVHKKDTAAPQEKTQASPAKKKFSFYKQNHKKFGDKVVKNKIGPASVKRDSIGWRKWPEAADSPAGSDGALDDMPRPIIEIVRDDMPDAPISKILRPLESNKRVSMVPR